jgi:hypothetical protein
MKKILKPLFVFLVIFFVGTYVYFFSGIVFPWQEEEVAQTVQEWGGLAPFPDNISNVRMSKSGSAFTRTFEIEFDAEATAIEKWIKESKRLKDNKPVYNTDATLFEVYPGEQNATGGTVEVKRNHVKIRMMWS